MFQRILVSVVTVAAFCVATGSPRIASAACNSPKAIAAKASFDGAAKGFVRFATRMGSAGAGLPTAQKHQLRNLLQQQYESSQRTLKLFRDIHNRTAKSSDQSCINSAYSAAQSRINSAYSSAYSKLS